MRCGGVVIVFGYLKLTTRNKHKQQLHNLDQTPAKKKSIGTSNRKQSSVRCGGIKTAGPDQNSRSGTGGKTPRWALLVSAGHHSPDRRDGRIFVLGPGDFAKS